MADDSQALSASVTQGDEGAFILALGGELDFLGAQAFSQKLTELRLSSPTTVVVDVSGLTFIDSTGLNALVAAAQSIQTEGGFLAVAGPSSHVARVFEIVRLGESVPVESSVEAALVRARAQRGEPQQTA